MITLGERAEQALRVVREAKEMAYDTETSGLDWHKHSVVGYVITTSDFNCYIPIRHGGGANLLDPDVIPLRTPEDSTPVHRFELALAAAFKERQRRGFLTIGHNLKFDMHMSANHGILLGRECEDTSLNAAMLNEFCRSFSLENLALEAGVTAKKGKDLYEHLARQFGCKTDHTAMEHYWQLAGDDVLAVDYAMGDGVSTLELRAKQIIDICEQEMHPIHHVECQLIYTIFRMERRGIRVDLSRLGAVQDEVEKRLAILRSTLPAGFNALSAPQVRKVMEETGHTDWPMTSPSAKFPDGQASFPEKWLKKYPKGKDIVAVRKWTNINSSFMEPLKNEHTINGRVYSSLNQLKGDEYGTISGRFSSSQPNLQQIPKRDKELSKLFRSVFVADEGMDFWEGDYSQCEPRLFAHYSKEPALLDGYSRNPPLDMHHVVASAFGVERDPTAKRMNMGILTGMYPPTFALHMDWPLHKAREEWDKWFALFPGIKDFQDLATGLFKNSGYVKTILKRRCRLDHPRFAYRAVSRIIQGSNADIVKYKLLEADKMLEAEGDAAWLSMTVHDSFNWQSSPSPEGRKISEELVKMFCNVQCAPFELRVPFTMDVGHGKNWSEATFGQ